MRWLNNIRVARKVAIAPVLGLVFLVGLGLVAGNAIRDVASSFDRVVTDSIPKLRWVAETENAIQSAQTRIFQSLVWQASNAPAENQKAARKAVVDQLTLLEDKLAEGRKLFNVAEPDPEVLEISKDNPADAVAARLEEEAKSLPEDKAIRNMIWALELRAQQYREAVERVRSMQKAVFTAAVTFAASAQQTFETLNATLERIAARIDKASAKRNVSVAKDSSNALTVIIASCVGAFALLGVISVFVGNRIAGPILKITSAMRRLADGETDTEVPEQGRRDEVGQMSEALGIFRDNSREMARLQAVEEENRRKADEQRKEMMRQIADQIDTSVQSVVNEVQRATVSLKASAQSMVETAGETTNQSASVASSAQQANANVENVSEAAQRLAGSIEDINRQVQDSARMASEAVSEAEKTDQTVKGLSTASEKIGDVISLINDIAEQTNLLALNATIEAARAGDAGKGFAVVANEVKNLASQTGKATEEIAGEINGIKSATAEAVSAIQSIGKRIREVNDTLDHVAAAVSSQGEATADISRNGSEAASGTSDVSREIENVQTAASRTGEVSNEVLSTSDHLAQEFDQLKQTVQGLIQQMRAA
jgi:methyl-accepting chemotaxis protein